MTFLRKKSLQGLGIAAGAMLAVALAVGIGILTHVNLPAARAAAEETGDEESAISVKTIRARLDPAFSVSIEQPAFVEAYYQAELKARVAGLIKPNGVLADIGDRVKAGEVLVQIDVPDLEQDVLQKDAVIAQRQSELALARTNQKVATSSEKAAGEWINFKTQEIGRYEASERFRLKELNRYRRLATGPNPAVTPDVIDEAQEQWEAAKAGSAAARAAVKDADAELEKARAKSEAAAADVKVAESLVLVAQKDRDKAKALLSFATIHAPFDGVVTRRKVDPGDFVQNATTANTDSLLTVVRDDIVTVYMKVPDRYAAYVKPGTQAFVQMETLPGLVLEGQVTRYAPSLENQEHDRTMRVEVDLYNSTAADWQAFQEKEKASANADLKSKTLPVFPKVEGKAVKDQPLRLIPGQFGTMRLVLRTFQNTLLLPHAAVFSQGGTSYIYQVKEGRALKMPVKVEADNGEEVKVVLVERVKGMKVHRELTGKEEIVFSNQGELSNDQPVKTTHVEW